MPLQTGLGRNLPWGFTPSVFLPSCLPKSHSAPFRRQKNNLQGSSKYGRKQGKEQNLSNMKNMNYNKLQALEANTAAGKSSVSCPLKPSDSAPLKHSTMPP